MSRYSHTSTILETEAGWLEVVTQMDTLRYGTYFVTRVYRLDDWPHITKKSPTEIEDYNPVLGLALKSHTDMVHNLLTGYLKPE